MARRDAEREAFVMDSEDEDDEWIEEQMDDDRDEPVLMVRRPGANPNRLPLHHFLRLIAGGRIMEHGAAATNEALVQSLRRNGVIQSDPVKRAMQLCPRDLFVPAEHADEALVDAPIRVERHGFNISAPHMHATCLEALQLRPGHRFLDVGSGCGLMTACGAYLVGPSGCAVGFDVRREALAMSRDAARRLTADSPEYASAACPMRFELQNVFMPSSRWLGQFDRVHVGAACPPDRLAPLLALLRPEGGLVVVPVTPSDLRVITRGPGGAVSQRVVSQVRFSELEVPSDAEVLLAALRGERRARTAPTRPPSTYARDVAAIVAAVTPTPTPQGSYGDACASFMPSSSPSGVLDGLPPTPHAPGSDKARPRRGLSRLFSACSSGSAADEAAMEGAASSSSGGCSEASSPTPPQLCPEELGEPDCVLVGPGWELPAHRAVLRQRCDHFRARCDAGWADSAAQVVRVPDHFGRAAVAAFLHYTYHDCMEECSDPQEAVAVLHVALYYSCPRLASLCEHRLAQLLRGRPRRSAARQRRGGPAQEEAQEEGDEGLADAAAALLALADEAGLPHLRAVALDYVVHNFGAVAATESYAALSREQVSLVAEEACAAHARLVQHIRRMADQQPLPDPSY